jgi:hypothetical protein
VAREDLFDPGLGETLFCDLTQSWSAKGGGVGTYIRHKRATSSTTARTVTC